MWMWIKFLEAQFSIAQTSTAGFKKKVGKSKSTKIVFMGFRVASDVESGRRNKKYNAGASTSHHSSMTQENFQAREVLLVELEEVLPKGLELE